VILPPRTKLLFIGDSITDAERAPTGEAAPWEPLYGLGRGYVSMIHAWLQAAHPAAGIRVVNKGTSGNTVRDLAGRWQTDVLDEHPGALAVMIGINDVWRQFDLPWRPEVVISPEEYRKTLDQLVEEARAAIPLLFLGTPYFIEPRRDDPMRSRMDEYGAIVREVASRHDAGLVDTQSAFDRVLVHMHPCALAWDRIHPGPAGHMIIAREFLRAFRSLTD
jgi:lysophospholipase L1-like esterase